MPRDERQRLALPVLRELKRRVTEGVPLLEALFSFKGERLHREFARGELIAVVPFSLTLDACAREQDMALLLLDRALKACSPVVAVRGGWGVSRRTG